MGRMSEAAAEGRSMSVSVDGGKCQGHNRCMAVCPEVFEADELGYAVVKIARVGPDLATAARLAEANCPERAITVE
jgi:ferredoxin